MYQKMYHILFNAITDAMEMIERQEYQGALSCLEKACLDAEEVYVLQPSGSTDYKPLKILQLQPRAHGRIFGKKKHRD